MKIAIKIEHGYIVPYSSDDVEKLKTFDSGIYEVDIKNMDLRSLAQNRALHLWCSQIAYTLNNSGLYVSQIIKAETEWNMNKVKENIFKAVVESLYDKKSTTKLNKNEFDKIIDTITLALGNKGISVPPFPSYDDE
jgi:hypothetical protein